MGKKGSITMQHIILNMRDGREGRNVRDGREGRTYFPFYYILTASNVLKQALYFVKFILLI